MGHLNHNLKGNVVANASETVEHKSSLKKNQSVVFTAQREREKVREREYADTCSMAVFLHSEFDIRDRDSSNLRGSLHHSQQGHLKDKQ